MGRLAPTTIRIVLASLLLFAAGFILLHGRVAYDSGDWAYTITHDDEYAFWVIADGFARTPRSDANPFYAEHAGETHALLSYPVVALVGTLSGWLDVSVLSFLPIWKIGAPFLAWLLIWICLVRIWSVGQHSAAALALCILSATLLLHGHGQHAILRFSRPVDAMGMAAVWLSCACNPGVLRGRLVWGAALSMVLVLLMSPFLAVFCTVSTWAAAAWRGGCRDADARRVLGLAVAATAFGLLLLMRVASDTDSNRWLTESLAFDGTAGTATALMLFIAAAVAVLLRCRKIGLQRSDQVLLCILAVEPCAALVEPILGRGYAFSVHRYYYLVFEMLAICAWLRDTIPLLAPECQRRAWETPAAIATLLGLGAVVTVPATNFLRLLPRDLPANADYENSLLLLQLVPVLALTLWALRRGPLRQAVRGIGGWLLTGVFVCACFATWPPQLVQANQDMPFAKAHDWLGKHARPGDVVLTLPPDYGLYDYVPLYSAASVYYNPYASRLVTDAYEKEYRKSVYFGLYCGILDRPGMPIPVSLAQRLQEFRLDYILAWKGPLDDGWRQRTAPDLPALSGMVHASVRRQLAPHLETVYEDDSCVLWRVRP